MFAIASRHNIVALTQIMPLNKVNEGLDLVRNNQARYRIVLQMN
jgi:D-arabinose 1-dehydrogenase-like Zn-dependent alcohol dehydrogenase